MAPVRVVDSPLLLLSFAWWSGVLEAAASEDEDEDAEASDDDEAGAALDAEAEPAAPVGEGAAVVGSDTGGTELVAGDQPPSASEREGGPEPPALPVECAPLLPCLEAEPLPWPPWPPWLPWLAPFAPWLPWLPWLAPCAPWLPAPWLP